MKMIKTRLRNRLADCNFSRLMRIAIEGPELQLVNFNDISEVYKEKNRCTPLPNVHRVHLIPFPFIFPHIIFLLNGKILGGREVSQGGGGISRGPPPLYKTLMGPRRH